MDVDSHYSVKLGKLIEDFELDVLRVQRDTGRS